MGQSLAEHLRGLSLDNFTIREDIVSIGAVSWRATPCRCGSASCDGWSLEPLARRQAGFGGIPAR